MQKMENYFFEDTPLDKLANKYKTPSYCYSVSEIESNYKLLKNSFKKIRPLICYAMKANFNTGNYKKFFQNWDLV